MIFLSQLTATLSEKSQDLSFIDNDCFFVVTEIYINDSATINITENEIDE